MKGIYKIVSPSGKIYIGQSINIERRFSEYKRLQCKLQRKLYHSILKYGWDNHEKFILEIVDNELNLIDRENYWKDYYRVLEIPSLCLRKDGTGGKDSEETKKRKSEALSGLKKSEQHRMNMRESATKFQNRQDIKERKRQFLLSDKNPARSISVRKKISESGKIAQNREETKLKKSLALKGKVKQCPYCKLIGGISNMTRYHFNNCKHKNLDD
jgi:group I intron endonuclease